MRNVSFFLLLLLCCSCASRAPSLSRAISIPKPTTVDEVIVVPVIRTNPAAFVAYWRNPDTNLWKVEFSTNLVTWQRCGNETVYLSPPEIYGLRKTETSTSWTTSFFVRIVRQ